MMVRCTFSSVVSNLQSVVAEPFDGHQKAGEEISKFKNDEVQIQTT